MTEYELETRQRIFSLIKEEPGLHFRELTRRLSMATGLLEFHLRYLEDTEAITTEEDKYYKHYFPASLDARDKKLLSTIRQNNPRRIVLLLLLHPSSNHKSMLSEFGFKPSTLSLYLNHLVKKGTILKEKRGRENLYSVADPQRVKKVLLSYKKSLLDELVDTFLDTWLDDAYR